MTSKGCQRHYSFIQPLKLIETKKKLTPGTLSPDAITTASSGYSTGGSSLSTTILPPVEEHQPHKIKSKSIHNLISKLKNLIISPKTKLIRSTTTTTTKEMPSTKTTTFRQYYTSYDLPSSTIATSNTISLPFTYYQKSPIKTICTDNQTVKTSYVTKTSNFDKISAWLDHKEWLTGDEQDNIDLLFIDQFEKQSKSSSSIEIDYQIMMKKTPVNSRTPRRSTSMVSTLSRPIIEPKHYENAVSPTSSFSSSILVKGMSDNLTPHKTYHLSRSNLADEQTNSLLPKSNRRRAIDFNRRRTVAGPTEPINNNKENLPNNRRQQIYRFSPSTNEQTKKYYFHSNPPVKNEDMLMNSYGLTLLQQQRRQSVSGSIIVPHLSETNSIRLPSKQIHRRPSIHLTSQDSTSDSLDDLLCDREVESYFYPNRRQSPLSHSQHIYVNLEPPPPPPPPSYLHGTLC